MQIAVEGLGRRWTVKVLRRSEVEGGKLWVREVIEDVEEEGRWLFVFVGGEGEEHVRGGGVVS